MGPGLKHVKMARAILTLILHLHSKFPQTATEWAEILALQKHFHSVEVHKWRQILRASVELLDEVCGSHAGLWGLGSGCITTKGFSFLRHKMRKLVPVADLLACWGDPWDRRNKTHILEKHPSGMAGSSHLAVVRIPSFYAASSRLV